MNYNEMRYDNEGDDVNEIDPLDCLLLPLVMTCGQQDPQDSPKKQ